MRRLIGSIALVLVPALAFALEPPARLTGARVHLLVAADTDDPRIGQSVTMDAERFPQPFQLFMPERLMSYAPAVKGADFRAERILEAMRRLDVTPGADTVVFYYSGHGAFDPNRREHYGLTPTGPLWMPDVERTLAALRPRLTVILSDACSVFRRVPTAPSAPVPILPTEPPPLLKSLFLDPAGIVNVYSSMPGQEALGMSDGGVFTNALYWTFLDGMRRRTSWSEVIVEVNRRTREPSPNQTAYAVRPLPIPLPNRLGVVVREDSERARAFGGLEITEVLDGTPATRVRAADGALFTFTRRDVITHVNGRGVRTRAEFLAALRDAPDRAAIRIVDGATDREAEYAADLEGGDAPAADADPTPRSRLGALAERTDLNRDRGGVTVTEVVPGGPATRIRRGTTGETASLAPGRDVVLEVDGTPVGDADGFRDAVARAGPVVRLRVYDSKTRETDVYLADLPD